MAEEKAATRRRASVNHVVTVNGQPVFSCDDTDKEASMKCSAVAMDHFNRCLAAGGKSDVRIVDNEIPKE